MYAIRSYYVTLNTNDEVVIEWPMRAPLGAPTNLVAWDSFGYSATYPDSDLNGENVIQSPFLPSEPLKVGFSIVITSYSIHYTKLYD